MGQLADDVGDQAVTVTVAGTVVAGDQLDGYTIHRGRSTVDEQPTAATCTLNVYAAALPSLPLPGDPLTVELGPDALTWLGIAAEHPAVPRFVGRVTEARIIPRRFTGTPADVVQVVAASPLAQLGRTFVGDVPWPAELDATRADHIFRAANAAPAADQSSFVSYTSPDLRGDPAPWIFTAGDGVLHGYAPGEFPTFPDFWDWALDTDAPPAAAGLDLADYFLGVTVDVTPGESLVLEWTGTVAGGDGAQLSPQVSLVIGPQSTPAPAGATAGGGALVIYSGVRSDLYVVPEGVTSLTIGVALTAADRFYTPGIKLDRLTLTPYDTSGPYLHKIGGTVEVLPRDVDRQPALGLLTELATDARGLVLDTRAGLVGYADADDRQGAPVAITLDDSEVIVGSEWATTLDGLVNDYTLGYGPAGAGQQATWQAVDQVSVATFGRFAVSRSTQLSNAADADRTARRILGLQSRPAYRMPQLSVDVLRTLATAAQRVAALGLDQSSLVQVSDFPTSGPLTTGRLWVEGYTEQLTRNSWRLALAVSSYLAGGAGLTYDDVPDALTYDQVPDDVTQLAAWGYDPS